MQDFEPLLCKFVTSFILSPRNLRKLNLGDWSLQYYAVPCCVYLDTSKDHPKRMTEMLQVSDSTEWHSYWNVMLQARMDASFMSKCWKTKRQQIFK